MKLLFAIVQDEDANRVMNSLNKKGYMVTKLSSTGGFLKAGNTTLLIGIDEQYVNDVLSIIESKSKSRKSLVNVDNSIVGGAMFPTSTEINVGGATVFILDVENYKKF